jgi:hypothetical protein
MTLSPCGKCHYIGYCDAFSEWWCKKWKTFLGYSISPHKCKQCDVIGEEGDVREIKNMFALLELEDSTTYK